MLQETRGDFIFTPVRASLKGFDVCSADSLLSTQISGSSFTMSPSRMEPRFNWESRLLASIPTKAE